MSMMIPGMFVFPMVFDSAVIPPTPLGPETSLWAFIGNYSSPGLRRFTNSGTEESSISTFSSSSSAMEWDGYNLMFVANGSGNAVYAINIFTGEVDTTISQSYYSPYSSTKNDTDMFLLNASPPSIGRVSMKDKTAGTPLADFGNMSYFSTLSSIAYSYSDTTLYGVGPKEMQSYVDKYLMSLFSSDINSWPSYSTKDIGVSANPMRGVYVSGYNYVTLKGSGTVVSFVVDVSSVVAMSSISKIISVGSEPIGITYDGTYLYVANSGDDTVSRILLTTSSVDKTISVGSSPTEIVWDGGSYVYVINSGDNTVSRILTSTGTVDKTISVGANPSYIAWDGGSYVYVTNRGSDTVSRILISSGNVDATISLPTGSIPEGIAWDHSNHMWVTCSGTNKIERIIISSGTLDTSYSVSNPSLVNYTDLNCMVISHDGSRIVSQMYIPTGDLIHNYTTYNNYPNGLYNFSYSTRNYFGAIAGDGYDGEHYLYIVPDGTAVEQTSTSSISGVYFQKGVWDHGDYIYAIRHPNLAAASNLYRYRISTSTEDPIALSGSIVYKDATYCSNGYMYLANYTNSRIDRVEIATGTISTFCASTYAPYKVCWDGGDYIYVTYAFTSSLPKAGKININTGVETIFNIWSVGNPAGVGDHLGSGGDFCTICWDGQADGYMYISSGASGYPHIVSVSKTTGTVKAILVGNFPADLAWDNSDHIWVCNRDQSTLSLVNIHTGVVDSTVSTTYQPYYICYGGPYWKDPKYMYMMDSNRNIWRYNTSTFVGQNMAITTSLSTYSALCWANGPFLYLLSDAYTSTSYGYIKEYNIYGIAYRHSGDITKVAGPIISVGDYLYIVSRIDNRVLKYSKATGQIVDDIVVGSFPSDITWDQGNYLYVSNTLNHTVSRINITTDSVDQTIDIGSGNYPTTISWNGSDFIFVGCGNPKLYKINRSTNTVELVATTAAEPKNLNWCALT